MLPQDQSERRWHWCVCTRMALTGTKCARCYKMMGTIYEIPVEYAGRHWHLSCLLDNLTSTDNNSLSLSSGTDCGGAGFHP